MSRTLNTLLACWMAVAATGTVVSHRHAARCGHAHGFGWLSLRPAADVPAAEVNPHHHFVLAGIEFGAIPGTRDDGGDSQVVAACPLPDVASVDDGAVSATSFTVPESRVAAPPVFAARASFAPSDLCDVARHARTGVLLS